MKCAKNIDAYDASFTSQFLSMVFGSVASKSEGADCTASNAQKLKFIEGNQSHYYYLISKFNKMFSFSDIFDERTGYNEQRKKIFVKTVNKKFNKFNAN